MGPRPRGPLDHKRILSPMCSLRVSPIALGAMSIGQAWEGMMGSMDKTSSFKLLDAFRKAGGNFIDTAKYVRTWSGALLIDAATTRRAVALRSTDSHPARSVSRRHGLASG